MRTQAQNSAPRIYNFITEIKFTQVIFVVTVRVGRSTAHSSYRNTNCLDKLSLCICNKLVKVQNVGFCFIKFYRNAGENFSLRSEQDYNYVNLRAAAPKRLCIFGPKGAIQIRYYYYYYLNKLFKFFK